jgi:hypothetical protein
MANDFHFTVHVGLLLMFFNEMWEMKYTCLALTCLAATMYQSFMTIATRGGYIIDVIGALIISHFLFIFAMWASYFIDVKLLGLSF